MTLLVRGVVEACLLVRLPEAEEAWKHLFRARKNVPHIVKKSEAYVVFNEGDADGGKTHFKAVEKHGAATDWKPRERIPRTSLV